MYSTTSINSAPPDGRACEAVNSSRSLVAISCCRQKHDIPVTVIAATDNDRATTHSWQCPVDGSVHAISSEGSLACNTCVTCADTDAQHLLQPIVTLSSKQTA
eukprot:GHRQ01022543.1.p1 GENE.GHRQ01022543.1~~GHRQ01022543.1.p1  ORF type:complete len:103 (-),score=0.95 GHRQ01022543.1:145-453(-)